MKLDVYSRPILMQHYPLYRQSDADCNDFDAAPLPIKHERFRERWECLSQEATYQLLTQAIFTPNNYAYTKCEIPRESHQRFTYIVGAILIFLWLIYSLTFRRRSSKYKYR
nr:unnamed protein product [Callosobruchus chinensis]